MYPEYPLTFPECPGRQGTWRLTLSPCLQRSMQNVRPSQGLRPARGGRGAWSLWGVHVRRARRGLRRECRLRRGCSDCSRGGRGAARAPRASPPRTARQKFPGFTTSTSPETLESLEIPRMYYINFPGSGPGISRIYYTTSPRQGFRAARAARCRPTPGVISVILECGGGGSHHPARRGTPSPPHPP